MPDISKELNFFERLALGRHVSMVSKAGPRFDSWPECADGEVRHTILPTGYFARPSTSTTRHMVLTAEGWDFWTMRIQIAEDVIETIRQLVEKDGSVREVRVATLQRLVTAEEWDHAEETFHYGRALAQSRTQRP